jgi:hypothetical protein
MIETIQELINSLLSLSKQKSDIATNLPIQSYEEGFAIGESIAYKEVAEALNGIVENTSYKWNN